MRMRTSNRRSSSSSRERISKISSVLFRRSILDQKSPNRASLTIPYPLQTYPLKPAAKDLALLTHSLAREVACMTLQSIWTDILSSTQQLIPRRLPIPSDPSFPPLIPALPRIFNRNKIKKDRMTPSLWLREETHQLPMISTWAKTKAQVSRAKREITKPHLSLLPYLKGKSHSSVNQARVLYLREPRIWPPHMMENASLVSTAYARGRMPLSLGAKMPIPSTFQLTRYLNPLKTKPNVARLGAISVESSSNNAHK